MRGCLLLVFLAGCAQGVIAPNEGDDEGAVGGAPGASGASGQSPSKGGSSAGHAGAAGHAAGAGGNQAGAAPSGGNGGSTITAGHAGSGGVATVAGHAGSAGEPTNGGAGGAVGGSGGEKAMVQPAGAAGIGGAPDVGGSAGAGGACVPVMENCTNGIDDDCNGKIDDCPVLSANYHIIFQNSGSQTMLLGIRSGDLSGRSIDAFGVADITATFTPATGAFAIQKTYPAPGGAFTYTGDLGGTALSGDWAENGNASNNGTFVGDQQTTRPASDLQGTFQIDADYDQHASMLLTVDDFGIVDGRMDDTNGPGSVTGVFDRGNGTFFFKKQYDSGDVFWWSGNVDPGGQTISNGTYGSTPAALSGGGWTASR